MVVLCWTLVLILSVGTSLADVDQDWLASIVEGIKNKYALGDTFSLAVNVPLNQDPSNLQVILQYDPADRVQQAVSEGRVYQGKALIAAAQTGALSRVLDNVQPFIQSSQGHFLILYSAESPCGPACTTNVNNDAIAAKIKDITQHWRGYAFVFSRVSDVPSAAMSQLSESFKQLDISKFGLNNIFRCFGDDSFECTSCSSGRDVTPSCVANNPPSDQEVDQDMSVIPAAGTDTGELIGQGLDIGTSLVDSISTGMGWGSGSGRGRKGKGGVRRRRGRKGKGGVRRRRGRKGKGGVRRRKGRKGKGGVRRRRGRKGKGGVRRRRGRKGKGGIRRRRGRKGRKGGRKRGRRGRKRGKNL